jgi:hypothetical protein
MGAAASPDLQTIEELARLQLTARRQGTQIGLHNVDAELRGLLELTGLAGVLPVCADVLPICAHLARTGRQTKEREQPFGVEEGDHSADAVS